MKTISKVKQPARPSKRTIKLKQEDSPVKLKINLRELRRQANLSLRDVTAKSKVSPATLARIEVGFSPDLPRALRTAMFYEKRVEDIWELR